MPHVYAVLDAMEAGRQSARTAASAERDDVGVAAFPSALVNLVAPLTGARTVPLGRVMEAEDDDALRELTLGHVDVAIVQEHSHQPYRRDPRLKHHRLLRDPLDLLLPPGWPAPASLAAAGDLPWVVSGAGSPCRGATEEAWRRAGITPDDRGGGVRAGRASSRWSPPGPGSPCSRGWACPGTCWGLAWRWACPR